MRLSLAAFDRVGYARLLGEHLDARAPARVPGADLEAQPRFRFADGFEGPGRSGQLWRMPSEHTSPPSEVRARGYGARSRPDATERAARPLFSDGFESARAAPVDLGEARSSASRLRALANATQAAAQDDGFRASVSDV